MDIVALTAFLAPYLGRLLKPVEDGLGDAAERLGDKAWEFAQQLWGRLRGHVQAKPAAAEVANDVAAAPNDEQARQALAYQLKKLLNEDAELAEQVRMLWDQASRDPDLKVQVTAQGDRSVAVGGNVSGKVSTGDTIARDPQH